MQENAVWKSTWCIATPMQNLAMGALCNQHASQCLKIVWLGLLVLTPNISLCRFTLVVLHHLLLQTQPLFRVLRTALTSNWERQLPSEFFPVLIRCVPFQVTAVVMGSRAKVKCQLLVKCLEDMSALFLRRPSCKTHSQNEVTYLHPLTLKFHKHILQVFINNPVLRKLELVVEKCALLPSGKLIQADHPNYILQANLIFIFLQEQIVPHTKSIVFFFNRFIES